MQFLINLYFSIKLTIENTYNVLYHIYVTLPRLRRDYRKKRITALEYAKAIITTDPSYIIVKTHPTLLSPIQKELVRFIDVAILNYEIMNKDEKDRFYKLIVDYTKNRVQYMENEDEKYKSFIFITDKLITLCKNSVDIIATDEFLRVIVGTLIGKEVKQNVK